jgi:Cu/Ag efflux pump CusA
MMRRIVASSLKFRRLVVAVAAGMIVFGIVQLGQQSIDRLPEFGPTTVEVRTEALGLSAVEVEQLITVPLEQDLLNGVPFVQDIHSESLPGLSSVVMIFEPGTQLLDARQVVQEKVAEAAVALPGVSAPHRCSSRTPRRVASSPSGCRRTS